MSGHTSQDSSLIRDAVGGSERALERLFDVVSPRMLATIRLMLGPQMRRRIESQDILQVTLLKAFHGIERFDGQGQGSLYGWLGAIARNEIRDQIDYQGRQKRDLRKRVSLDGGLRDLQARVESEVSRIHLRERELQLEQALESLSDSHHEIIVLRRFEELSFPEIAQRISKSPDACRMLFARAMAALTREMRDDGT